MFTTASSHDENLHDQLVLWLQDPRSYPHAPDQVEYIETHISQVFLAGEFVFKLKKPVRYDFLDFSTLELREQACREELRLNRRLAEQVYIDVVSIARNSRGEFNWRGEGEIIDWVVQMRRLPTDRTLDVLLAQNQLTPEQIDQLAARLVTFYASLEPLAVTAQDYCEHFKLHVQGNSAALLAAGHHLPAAMAKRTQSFQMQLLACCSHLFAERVEQRRIFEGHGDLRPEHICFAEPLSIFDCIEFNADFRRIDVADELAFLAAECDFHGAEWIGPRLFARYETLSGDHPPQILIDFYKTYRATVRAKVAALRADQLSGAASESASQEALQHLQGADRYASQHVRPLVLIVGGLSGSGKTTLARALAEHLVADLLRTDVIRQTLFPANQQEDIYTPELRNRVYAEMFRQATELHQNSISVVLDATFSNAELIRQACSVAKHPRAIVLAVECYCRDEIARERIQARAAAGYDASQATIEVLAHQRQSWQPRPAELPQCRVDTEQPIAQQVEQVLAALGNE